MVIEMVRRRAEGGGRLQLGEDEVAQLDGALARVRAALVADAAGKATGLIEALTEPGDGPRDVLERWGVRADEVPAGNPARPGRTLVEVFAGDPEAWPGD